MFIFHTLLHVADVMFWVVGNKMFLVPCVVRTFKALSLSIAMAYDIVNGVFLFPLRLIHLWIFQQ
jgi:hypothetical protein